MDNVTIPAVAEGIIGGAIHNDVHNIFEQTLFAPEPTDSVQPNAPIESPDGTVVMPDSGPRIADDEVVNTTGTVLDETQNDNDTTESGDGNDATESGDDDENQNNEEEQKKEKNRRTVLRNRRRARRRARHSPRCASS